MRSADSHYVVEHFVCGIRGFLSERKGDSPYEDPTHPLRGCNGSSTACAQNPLTPNTKCATADASHPRCASVIRRFRWNLVGKIVSCIHEIESPSGHLGKEKIVLDTRDK
jgi:hypothetical protein